MEPKSRKIYTSAVNETMGKAAKFMPGNPVNVSYWASAKDFFPALKDFSADSLRAHWVLLQSKQVKHKPNKIVLPVKTKPKVAELNLKQKPGQNSRLSDYVNEPFVPAEPKEEEIETNFESDKETEKKSSFKEAPSESCEKVRRSSGPEMQPQDIIDCFYDLVDICSFCSGRRLTEKVVLDALIANDGLVKNTVDFFKRIN